MPSQTEKFTFKFFNNLKFYPMTGYFLIGFGVGLTIALVFIVGRFYNYKKEVDIARKNVDRLERFNSDLQFELKNMGRAKELSRLGL